MKRIIITDAYFPPGEAEKWGVRLHANIFNLDGAGVEGVSNIEPLLTTEETWNIWAQAYRFTQEWYLVADKDYTLYQDISIGRILEIELWYYWRDLFEQIEVLKKILDLTKPDEIYLATSKNKRIAQLLKGFWQTAAPVKRIEPSLTFRVETWKDMEIVRHRLKEWNLDRYIRLVALFFNKLKHGRKHTQHDKKNSVIDVLALLEQPATYVADSVLPVLKFFPSTGILLLDPRHWQRAAQSDSEIIYQTDFLWWHLHRFWYMQKLFLRRYHVYQAKLPQSLQYKGKQLGVLALDKVQHLFRWVFPLVALEIAGARQLLAERKIKSLLLVTDAHHGNRLYTMVANQQGIPSLVVQHGATMGEWGYVPFYATRFAAWGEISAEWMIARGVPHERLVITGQPRLDTLVNLPLTLTRETLCAQLNLTPDGFWLLWAMDPIPKLENDRILETLLEAVSQLNWCYLIIRPHPGNQQLGWISDRVRKRERVVISSAQEPLYDMLNIVNAIVIQGSTVGIEAMAMDKPVLVLQEGDFPGNALYVQSGAAVKVSLAVELCQELAKIYHCQQAGIPDSYASGRREFIRRYLLKVDGQSAKRVAEAIAAMQKET